MNTLSLSELKKVDAFYERCTNLLNCFDDDQIRVLIDNRQDVYMADEWGHMIREKLGETEYDFFQAMYNFEEAIKANRPIAQADLDKRNVTIEELKDLFSFATFHKKDLIFHKH